jgi:hypothetical protein
MEPMRPVAEDACTGSSAVSSWRLWLTCLAAALLGVGMAAVYPDRLLLQGLAGVVLVVSVGALYWWRHRARTQSTD